MRAVLRGETYVPWLVLACILPLHVLWMRDCAGIVRRRRAVVLALDGMAPAVGRRARGVRARAWRRSAVLLHEALA